MAFEKVDGTITDAGNLSFSTRRRESSFSLSGLVVRLMNASMRTLGVEIRRQCTAICQIVEQKFFQISS